MTDYPSARGYWVVQLVILTRHRPRTTEVDRRRGTVRPGRCEDLLELEVINEPRRS